MAAVVVMLHGMQIWVGFGSGSGFLPVLWKAITWTNVNLSLVEPLGTDFSEIWKKSLQFSIEKTHLNMLSAKWLPFCFGLNVLIYSDHGGKQWQHTLGNTIFVRLQLVHFLVVLVSNVSMFYTLSVLLANKNCKIRNNGIISDNYAVRSIRTSQDYIYGNRESKDTWLK